MSRFYRFDDCVWRIPAPKRQPEMAVKESELHRQYRTGKMGHFGISDAFPIVVGQCLECGLPVMSDQSRVSVWGIDHYHARCWNAMADRKQEEEEE